MALFDGVPQGHNCTNYHNGKMAVKQINVSFELNTGPQNSKHEMDIKSGVEGATLCHSLPMAKAKKPCAIFGAALARHVHEDLLIVIINAS